MGNNDFSIDRKTRGLLSKGRRIYSVALGAYVLIVGSIPLVRNGFSFQEGDFILHETFILMGVLQILFGLIGKELYTIRYRLKIDSQSMKIKKTFESKVLINLNSITHLKTLPMRLEFCFGDYVKTYDFSWLTLEEFEKLKVGISDYCMRKNIEIE